MKKMAAFVTAGLFGLGCAAHFTRPAASVEAVISRKTPIALTAPTNLRVQPVWDKSRKSATNRLTWDAVPGAVEANIYKNDMFLATCTGTSYEIPADMFRADQTYTVTAVDKDGKETRSSNIVSGIPAWQPGQEPGWAGPYTPPPPAAPTAASEWNGGKPRIVVTWAGTGFLTDVYRDGQRVAAGVWPRYWIDENVRPGETHSYAVTAVNAFNSARPASAVSPAVTATARREPPRAGNSILTPVRVIPNDDSVTIVLPELSGDGRDYRVYDIARPGKVKYAGLRTAQTRVGQPSKEPLAIEWNGIDPEKGATLVVEMVDKPGPFQKTHGSQTAVVAAPRTSGPKGRGAGAALTTPTGIEGNLNGQGDPSNIPIVLARSQPFHAACRPRLLTGQQMFFDDFRSPKPLKLLPTPPRPSGVACEFYGDANTYQQYANDKWLVGVYGADPTVLPVFTISNHIHDVLADGGSASGNIPNHNNNASVTFTPLRSGKPRTFDISGGKVLHATFEVDAHFDSRRWCSLFVTPDEPLANPGKSAADGMDGRWPNVSGNCVLWEVQAERHKMTLLRAGQRSDLMQAASFNDEQSFGRIHWDHKTPRANGTTQDLDKRHRFDLYLSRNRFRLTERDAQGNLVVQREKEFPAGMTLPFERGRLWFAHEVYHTSNDHGDLITYNPEETYWINYRPWSDERHWDNMGQEVLNRFPVP